jgi:hypothetical protein
MGLGKPQTHNRVRYVNYDYINIKTFVLLFIGIMSVFLAERSQDD